MDQNWYLIYAYTLGVSFILSMVLTGIVRRFALRWDILDHPGERKMHDNPIPLMGGVAICLTFFVVIVVHVVGLDIATRLHNPWLETNILTHLNLEEGINVLLWGEGAKTQLLGVCAGAILIFILGIVDDIKIVRLDPRSDRLDHTTDLLLWRHDYERNEPDDRNKPRRHQSHNSAHTWSPARPNIEERSSRYPQQ